MKRLRHLDLRPYHTLAAPALANELCILEERDELREALPEDQILGGGSNIIFLPEVRQRLIQLQWRGIEAREKGNEVEVTAQAGTPWQDVVEFCCAQGWYGLENLAAIYGSVGAAPLQNIGAYGVEIAEKIKTIEIYHRREKRFFWLTAAKELFSYRHSRLKQEPDWLVVALTLRLQKKGVLKQDYGALSTLHAETPYQQMQNVMAIRAQRLPAPEQYPNAGSFFHNPVVDGETLQHLQKRFPDIVHFPYGTEHKIAAAWCIEHCGFKGFRAGKVGISAQHALVLINDGGTGQEILDFAAQIQAEVQARFGLRLQIEPSIVGQSSV